MKNKGFIVFLCVLICFCVGIYGYLVYFNFKYPLFFKAEILEYSKKYDLSCEFIASVINAESGFNKNAVSNKGAVGLMQIMPKTAQYIAQKLGEEYSYENLFEPKTNIRYGVYYLCYLKQKFEDEQVVLCAYNAGEGVVMGWLGDEKYSSDQKTLIDIPYPATRQYVQKVLSMEKVYAKKFA